MRLQVEPTELQVRQLELFSGDVECGQFLLRRIERLDHFAFERRRNRQARQARGDLLGPPANITRYAVRDDIGVKAAAADSSCPQRYVAKCAAH